jgi:mono/diheme cytochrome c family protein
MDRWWWRAAAAALVVVLAASSRTARAEPAPAGDPAAGRALFVGARAFSAGGPPCGACHGVGGEGRGLAAAFGPDLSGAAEAFGGAEQLDGLLESLPFPSMEPLYAGRALTPVERADLAAFLVATGGRAPASEDATIALHAGVAFAGLLLGLALAGRGRGTSTRDRILAAARRRPAPFTPGDPS